MGSKPSTIFRASSLGTRATVRVSGSASLLAEVEESPHPVRARRVRARMARRESLAAMALDSPVGVLRGG